MQLNKIILLLIFSLAVSCHGVSQESKNSDAGNTNSQTINFFDKQYNTSYQLVIDASTIADHPFYSYLDCDKEGYFTIHFVPKSKELRDFWSNQFYKGIRLDTHNFDNDTIKIRATIQSNQAAYNIFCFYVNKDNLSSNGDCTIESVYLKEHSTAAIYLYDQGSEQWKAIKKINAQLLPPYASDSFFINLFPNLFSYEKDTSKSRIQNISIDSTWYGNYSMVVDCGVRNGQHAEWSLNITITPKGITAMGKGYETNFSDELTAVDKGNKLILNHKKQHPGFDSGGEKMSPEFLLIKDNDKYYIQSEWLESDEIMSEPQKSGFEIKKQLH